MACTEKCVSTFESYARFHGRLPVGRTKSLEIAPDENTKLSRSKEDGCERRGGETADIPGIGRAEPVHQGLSLTGSSLGR